MTNYHINFAKTKLVIYMTMLFVKAYTCYRLTAVADMLVNREFSLLNVFFLSNYREVNGKDLRADV